MGRRLGKALKATQPLDGKIPTEHTGAKFVRNVSANCCRKSTMTQHTKELQLSSVDFRFWRLAWVYEQRGRANTGQNAVLLQIACCKMSH